MSEVQSAHSSVARGIPVDAGALLPGSDGVAALAESVHAMAVRATLALGRAQAVTRTHAERGANDSLHTEAAAAREALCTAVGALAARLRRDALPPQRMLVVVKHAVRGEHATTAEPFAGGEIMSDAVRCGIHAYYAAS